MAIIVYLETENGDFKKSALEVSSYGRKLADEIKTNLYGIAFNSDDPLSEKYWRMIEVDKATSELHAQVRLTSVTERRLRG